MVKFRNKNIPYIQANITASFEERIDKNLLNKDLIDFLLEQQKEVFISIQETYLERNAINDNNADIDVMSIVTGNDNHILVGDAGYGKTYFAEKIDITVN